MSGFYTETGSRRIKTDVLAVAVALCCGMASAVTFSGSGMDNANGTGLAASATFETDGHGDLVVTLANSYTGDTLYQADVLTALFFSGGNGLTPISANAPTGNTFWTGTGGSTLAPYSPPSSDVLGQQWEYSSGLSGAPGGASAGISSTGLGLFGNGNFAANGANIDGTSYGLVSDGYSGTGNDGLKGSKGSPNYYIQDSMTFVLGGFNGSLADISQVTFQYGSKTSEPSFAGNLVVAVPEPSYGIGTAVSVLPLVGWCFLKRRRSQSTAG